MGNIITPTPGDLVDRQTILQLKLEHCGITADSGYAPQSVEMREHSTSRTIVRTKLLEKTTIDIQPLLLENEAIQRKLEKEWFPELTVKEAQQFDELFPKLQTVNGELWKLEDQARIFRAAPEKFLDTVLRRKAELLDAITMSNDYRIELVGKINALWKIQAEEKIYA